jgi:hypothetical protein
VSHKATWAILAYSNNQAQINHKKGADKGVDGVAFFMIDANSNGKAILQVKSGGANRATIATLNSDRLREGADFGILITMDDPTKSMREEALVVGKYKHPMLSWEGDRIKIITIQEILDGCRLDLPLGRKDIIKQADVMADVNAQNELF